MLTGNSLLDLESEINSGPQSTSNSSASKQSDSQIVNSHFAVKKGEAFKPQQPSTSPSKQEAWEIFVFIIVVIELITSLQKDLTAGATNVFLMYY